MKKLLLVTLLGLSLSACQVYDNPKNSKTYSAITQNPWSFIQKGFSVDVPENDRIAAERRSILLNAKFFENAMIFSEPYIYYIANQMHKNNMPLELALVPLIESVYNPLATSRVKAAGLWQFMPITAREYNMQRDSMFDARRDVIASTKGAISLLQDLNKRFNGDWLLAIAAYNAGEGRIKRAISYNKRKNLPTNFWALDLPHETMRYVPRLLAMIDVIKNKDKYGINLPDLSYENALVRIDLSKNVSLATISEYSSIPQKDLLRYNAGYIKKKVTGPFHLLVPYVYAEDLHQKLAAQNLAKNEIVELLQSGQFMQTQFDFEHTNTKYSDIDNEMVRYYTKVNNINRHIKYVVKRGDNMSSIAKKYRVKVSDIKRWNKLKDSRIRAGQKLALIINASSLPNLTANVSHTSKPIANNSAPNNKKGITYIIKRGDNLYSIAKNYRVKVNDILRWNNMKTANIIAGQQLTINL